MREDSCFGLSPDWIRNQTTSSEKQAERRGEGQNNDVLNSGLWNSRNEIPRSGKAGEGGTLRSFRNFICSLDGTECAVKKRRLERERGGDERGGRIDFPGFVFQEDRKKREPLGEARNQRTVLC